MDVDGDDINLPFLDLYAEREGKKGQEEGVRENGSLSDVVPCAFGCDEKYCSVRCRDTAAYLHHKVRGQTRGYPQLLEKVFSSD